MNCRNCGSNRLIQVLDLGHAPPTNSYRCQDELKLPEVTYPLAVAHCEECSLLQTTHTVPTGELFHSDYQYFSSTSSTWSAHVRDFVLEMIPRMGLGQHSLVMEVASNDGYLLREFVAKEIQVVGIEPTASTATHARKLGVRTVEVFLGKQTAEELVNEFGQADLVIANNVLAHVPDLDDFVGGLAKLVSDDGLLTVEFPHVANLIRWNQFDTIYHEHFSYLSLSVVSEMFRRHGLRTIDVQKLQTHGGSLRVFAAHSSSAHLNSNTVNSVLAEETGLQLGSSKTYGVLQQSALKIRDDLLDFLINARREGRTVVGVGAAAKGTTLLNYCGVDRNYCKFVVDSAVAKQGLFLPGCHIPILGFDALASEKIDDILILPWNIADELGQEVRRTTDQDVKLWRAIPALQRV